MITMAEKNYQLDYSESYTGVSTYHNDNGSYTVFDSHAKDEYGRSHPSGTHTCTIRSTILSELSTVFPDYTLTL